MINIIIAIFGVSLFIGLIIYFIVQIKVKKNNPLSECDCCKKKNILKQYHKKYKTK